MNLATPFSAPSAEEIRESGSAFQSLMMRDGGGGEATLINISIGYGDLICDRMIISAAPNQGDKVICLYSGFTFQTFV